MEKPLALLKSLTNGENVLLYSSPFDIGRSKIAKLIIPQVNISRNHCQLICCKKQAWILKDLSSSGTYVNGKLIGKGNSETIKDNDVIRLGPENCNFIWEFTTNVERFLESGQSNSCDVMVTQSQAIVDICNEKDTLQRQIILNRESCLKMKLEKENAYGMAEFMEVYIMEATARKTDRKGADNDTNETLKIKFGDIQSSVCKEMVIEDEEEKKAHIQAKRELLDLQKKITENSKKEEELKLEVKKLQEKLLSEQMQWEKRFLEEKKKLEDQINEQNKKLAVEKVKIEVIPIPHDPELEDILKKEEEEKKMLMGKLHELEEAKKILSQKLKESDEFHLLDKAKIEEEMQKELLKREEDFKALLQQHTDCLQSNQISAINSEKDQKENQKNQDLLKELDQVKNTLIESESRQKLLEQELAEINSLKDQAIILKSNVLENMADLMESELQCSICSELFVTAITLNCTHTFCKYCIDTWKKKKKSCPVCRKKITSENRSIAMDNYIDRMVENLSDEFKIKRRAVVEERICEKPCKVSKTTSSSESSTSGQPTTSASRRRVQNSRVRNGWL